MFNLMKFESDVFLPNTRRASKAVRVVGSFTEMTALDACVGEMVAVRYHGDFVYTHQGWRQCYEYTAKVI